MRSLGRVRTLERSPNTSSSHLDETENRAIG